MAKKKDFFVSYNKADRFWAAGIREWLLGLGRTVIMQSPDFHPGSNFVLEMHEGLRGAKRMIGVLSPDYLESHFCSPEWAAKFAEDPAGRERLLIFVKVRECKPDGLLGQIVNIDLTGLTVEAAEAKFFEDLEGLTNTATEAKGKRSPSEKNEPGATGSQSGSKAGTVINQQSKGARAQNIGVQNNLYPSFPVKNEIKPGPEHITPAQRSEIHRRLTELGEREAMVGVKKKFPEGAQTPEEELAVKELTSRCFRFLRADFNRQVNDGQPYHLLPLERYEKGLTWIAQRKAIKRSSLRRTDNELWRRDYERIIWGGMRDRKWQKQDVYDYAIEKEIVDSPITSLKELKEQKLEALAKAMRTKRTKPKKPL